MSLWSVEAHHGADVLHAWTVEAPSGWPARRVAEAAALYGDVFRSEVGALTSDDVQLVVVPGHDAADLVLSLGDEDFALWGA